MIAHQCNAYCADSTHVTLMFTKGKNDMRHWLGFRIEKNGRVAEIVKIEEGSPESERHPAMPPDVTVPWLVSWKYVDVP